MGSSDQLSPVKNGDATQQESRVDSFVRRIHESWHKAAANILAVAKLCADAQRHLDFIGEIEDLKARLPFSPSTYSKLVKIGKDKRFDSAEVAGALPPSFTIIYELARLSQNNFSRAMEEGVIKPSLTREDLKSWRQGSSKPPRDEFNGLEYFAGIYVPRPFQNDNYISLKSKLEGAESDLGVKIKWTSDDNELKRECQAITKLPRRALSKARQIIRSEKKNYKRRLKAWPWTKDEIHLDINSTVEEMYHAMEMLDRHDEFQKHCIEIGIGPIRTDG